MTSEGIKRILVALDASTLNKSTLLAATHLANRFHAHLETLYIEDINLLRLAELPIAREVSGSSYQVRQLTTADMERQLRTQVERLRRFVQGAAQQARLNVEFRVLRGQVASELNLALSQVDLLIMGKNTQPLRHSEKLGRITRHILESANCHVMLVQYGGAVDRPVAVLYTGTEASRRALQLGIQLAEGDHDQLSIFYPSLPANEQEALQAEAMATCAAQGINPMQLVLKDAHVAEVLTALQQCKGRILILESKPAPLTAEDRQALLQQSKVPVILVR